MYSQLPEDLKLVYRKLDEAVKNLETKVSFDVDITYDNRYEVYYMYMADHPEYFYLDSTFAMTYGGGQFGFQLAYSDGQTSCGYKQEITEMTDAFRTSIAAKKAIFDAEVERIISTIPADAPDVVKERIIYDYIQQAAHYNHDLDFENIRPAQDDFSAYGVLINKTGVCESYAEAFQVLCYAVGINCTAINGVANGGGHK
jgi:transglutaminase/protease-like cytokinesis protein 3